MSLTERLQEVKASIPEDVTLVAVSKTHPAEMIREAYDAGQRIFGENRPQELREKYPLLPPDIRWHMIGHLQTNKVKYIGSLRGAHPFGRFGQAAGRDRPRSRRTTGPSMSSLKWHVAMEETKSGWAPESCCSYLAGGAWRTYGNVRIRGLMAVASQTDDDARIRAEFTAVHGLFREFREAYFGAGFDTLSMGMTHDYPIAVECGATMVRIGSRIFGERDYRK